MALELKDFNVILDDLLTEAKARLQRITNLNEGSLTYGILATVSAGLAELYKQIGEGVALAFSATSSGTYLTDLAEEHGLTRKEALKTAGTVFFVRDVADGPKTIPAGTVVSTGTDNFGKFYRYTTDSEVVLPAGETEIAAAVTAESVGQAYNVAGGAIDVIVTPVPGIDRVENRSEWIDSVGTDRESDAELAARIVQRWAAITFGATRLTYISWAGEVNGVGDVACDDTQPRGDGTVDVIILAVGGLAPPPSLIAQVQALIDSRRPLTSDVLTKGPALILADISVTATKHPHDGEANAVKTDIESALSAMFAEDEDYQEIELLGIGDDLTLARISREVMNRSYVINIEITLPADDLVIDFDQKADLDSLTVIVQTALET